MADTIVAEKYEDLPLTNFPVGIDTWPRMMDVTLAMYPLVIQYNEYFKQGNFTACNNLLTNNPDLINCRFTSTIANQMMDAIKALERFFMEDYQAFVQNVAKSAIGINDNPTDEEKSLVSYSAEKVDSLFAKYHTLRNITIPASGWSDKYPYTNTVAVDGMTADIDIRVVGVYAPEGATLEEVKAWNKSAGMLMGNNDATADGTVTFKAYKKPAVDFTVTTEGG